MTFRNSLQNEIPVVESKDSSQSPVIEGLLEQLEMRKNEREEIKQSIAALKLKISHHEKVFGQLLADLEAIERNQVLKLAETRKKLNEAFAREVRLTTENERLLEAVNACMRPDVNSVEVRLATQNERLQAQIEESDKEIAALESELAAKSKKPARISAKEFMRLKKDEVSRSKEVPEIQIFEGPKVLSSAEAKIAERLQARQELEEKMAKIDSESDYSDTEFEPASPVSPVSPNRFGFMSPVAKRAKEEVATPSASHRASLKS